MEGRWGNSIRFGSTVKERPNNWSTIESNGDPITILRNGQGDNRPEGWLPTVEDINKDDSSIYLTSTQKIPINISSNNDYCSYKTDAPILPNEYSGKQILLNSGRLIFNTTEDHILLASKKSINLNAINSVNIETTGPIVLETNPISGNGGVYLGSQANTQPVLLGDSTVDLLNTLISQVKLLANSLSNDVIPPGGGKLPLTSANASNVSTTLNTLDTSILLSSTVRTSL